MRTFALIIEVNVFKSENYSLLNVYLWTQLDAILLEPRIFCTDTQYWRKGRGGRSEKYDIYIGYQSLTFSALEELFMRPNKINRICQARSKLHLQLTNRPPTHYV